MKIALASNWQQSAPVSKGDLLLQQAEKAVRHKLWLRKTLPLNLLMFLPMLMHLVLSAICTYVPASVWSRATTLGRDDDTIYDGDNSSGSDPI